MPEILDLRPHLPGAPPADGQQRTGEPNTDMVFLSTMPVPAYEHLPEPMHYAVDAARERGAIGTDPFPIAHGQATGRLAILPWGGHEIMEHRDDVAQRTMAMAGYAEHVLGASVLGLGSLTVPLTRGGRRVTEHAEQLGLDIAIDHGDDATAAVLYDGMIRAGVTRDDRIVILGPGVVGKGLTELLAANGYPVTLWGQERHARSMLDFVADLDAEHLIATSIDQNDIHTHNVAFVLTSGGEFPPNTFADGTLIFDGAIPRGTTNDPEWDRRGIVRVPYAGQVAAPDICHVGAEWGTNAGELYGCAAGCCWHAIQVRAGQKPQHHVGATRLDYMQHLYDTMISGHGWRHVSIPTWNSPHTTAPVGRSALQQRLPRPRLGTRLRNLVGLERR